MRFDFRSHKGWIGLMVLAILVGAGNAPLLGAAEKKAAQKLVSLKKENEKAVAALRQMEEDLATVEKMKTVIDDNAAKKYLAPVDRLDAAQILERRAAEAGLTRFTYTLSPEKKASFDMVGISKHDLATSQWTVTADAPSDVDVYAFLDAISHTLPGRITVHQISLQRITEEGDPISFANIRFAANGEWLSNGASPNPAEGK
ncbi:MAG: hypothetical protein WC464_06385 [Bdellovibrionales bacterium]